MNECYATSNVTVTYTDGVAGENITPISSFQIRVKLILSVDSNGRVIKSLAKHGMAVLSLRSGG